MSDGKKAKIWESFQYQNNQDILHHTECGSLLKIHFTKKIELGRIPSQLQQHFFSTHLISVLAAMGRLHVLFT